VPAAPDIRSTRDPDALDRAAAILAAGGLVAVPTETVYGLAADAANAAAVARIFTAKGRPAHNPLIAHVDGLVRASTLVELGPVGRALADAFWPGPLTLVARRRPGSLIAPGVAAGLSTLAVRCPDAPLMRQLIERLDRPLAAPSANRSGAVSPTTAAHVADSLGGAVDLILDDGPCSVGVESTILDISEAPVRLLRPGGVSRARIKDVVGPLAAAESGAPVNAPGQMESHYAPKAKLRLNADAPEPGEAWLGFGPDPETLAGWPAAANLSPTADLGEAAANLYAHLIALDRKAGRIAVASVPREGLGEAINDRLRRAATGRS